MASLVINLYMNVPPIYVPEIYDENIYRISVNVYGRYSTSANGGGFLVFGKRGKSITRR
jgi:hypothetical protein